jgi:hypothetical protein
MLDPNPDSMNQDPKHWFFFNSKIENQKNDEKLDIKVFLIFLLVAGRIQVRICTNNDGFGSRRPKNIHIRIHDTAKEGSKADPN